MDKEDYIEFDKYLEKVSELESDYENLEQNYWVHVSVLIGVIAQLYFGKWYVSICVIIAVCVIGLKFFAKKPFSSNLEAIGPEDV